jgi:copper chaperone
MSIQLNVSGMTCGHCETAVAKALKGIEGVQTVQVDLKNGTAKVEGQNVNTDALIAAVIDEGYGASVAGA